MKFPVITEEDLMGEARAYIRYDMHTLSNGGFTGTVETNDNNDDGVAGEIDVWEETFKDRAQFDKIVGRSRTGISGIKVTVLLDGKELT